METFFKQKPFISKKLRHKAKDIPYCMSCKKPNNGTIVGAHYQGFRQHEFGKGMGQKGTDSAMAFICMDCHTIYDQYKSETDIEQSESFLMAIVRSHDYLLKNGGLSVC